MNTTKYSDRDIPQVSLHDFDDRIDQITSELVAAAETDGFFTLVNHGISVPEIEAQFDAAERFFALPDETKAAVPFSHKNVGWEKQAQVRPSTGKPDQKESYQMQFGQNMDGMWLAEEKLPGFRERCMSFMWKCQKLSEKLMVCFARGLDLPDDYFVNYHDATKPNIQTVLRILHYFPLDPTEPTPEGYHRAGAHADWCFLTLLFQRPGQSGLEICPGREVFTAFGLGDSWTKVEPAAGQIVCNIGDLLMSWSDDRFKSTFHRVKTPMDPAVDYFGRRYSIAFFNQPNTDCEIQGPKKKYPMVTGTQFTEAAMKRNFAALEAAKAGMVASAS